MQKLTIWLPNETVTKLNEIAEGQGLDKMVREMIYDLISRTTKPTVSTLFPVQL